MIDEYKFEFHKTRTKNLQFDFLEKPFDNGYIFRKDDFILKDEYGNYNQFALWISDKNRAVFKLQLYASDHPRSNCFRVNNYGSIIEQYFRIKKIIKFDFEDLGEISSLTKSRIIKWNDSKTFNHVLPLIFLIRAYSVDKISRILIYKTKVKFIVPISRLLYIVILHSAPDYWVMENTQLKKLFEKLGINTSDLRLHKLKEMAMLEGKKIDYELKEKELEINITNY
ncbi:hypothetical protein EI74_0629 [Mycoplasma testudineum]|uniref:Uncharacterized protein n=1 Tax=Mycoplasma testudineum TaxID=244584 RepID=A0A4R6ID44_9MOLU|nr:hypothetical protein [Mycoplasma testudineum]OYD26694.1 hypothetical protein CG473_02750 [Mycoplasma testudineum]TDO19824.1 hypothetical protein EI74_0629 [Mycoplasma testudineum]